MCVWGGVGELVPHLHTSTALWVDPPDSTGAFQFITMVLPVALVIVMLVGTEGDVRGMVVTLLEKGL